MKFHVNFLDAMIISLMSITLSACSTSTNSVDTELPIISDVSFPFFANNPLNDNNALYDFDPMTGKKEMLLQSNKGLIITLDTDASNKKQNASTTVFDHSILPEYVVYVQDQALHLYDLHTRHDHSLLNLHISEIDKADAQRTAQILAVKASNAETAFEAEELLKMRDKVLNEALDKHICDLRKSIILDEKSFLDKRILFKEEKKVYLKTSLTESDCLNKNANFEFFEVIISDSLKDTFKIRRKILKEHDHQSKHQHEHKGNHNHKHNFADGELDNNGNIFDINNHIHPHLVKHDFIYGDLEEHKYLSKDELDQVHNNPENQDEITEELPVFVGRKVPVDQALMYAGLPIVDINNQQYGYLGFNQTESAYKFYTIDTEIFEKTLLWQMSDSQFSIKRRAQAKIDNSRLLQPDMNKHRSYSRLLKDGILLSFNSKLVKWKLTDLFDDDKDVERLFSIDQPLFEFNGPDSSRAASYNLTANTFIIKDLKQLFFLDNGIIKDTPHLIRTVEDTNLTNFQILKQIGSQVVLLKSFSQKSSSVTKTDIQTAQEQTLQAKTSDAFRIDYFLNGPSLNDIFITKENIANSIFESQYYPSSLIPHFTPALTNSIFAPLTDYRVNSSGNINYRMALLKANSLSKIVDTGAPFLLDPNVYFFDSSSNTGEGLLIGRLPDIVGGINISLRVIILNDSYGFIEFTSDDASNTISTYYFPPGLNSINPTGEFGDMKFMTWRTP